MTTSEENYRRISLPKTSFTAFRLTYSTSKEVSELAKCVLLGRIPDAWIGGKQSGGLLSGVADRAKSLMKQQLRSTMSVIQRSIVLSALNFEMDEDDEEFNYHLQKNRILEKTVREAFGDASSEDDSDTESKNEDTISDSDSMLSEDTDSQDSDVLDNVSLNADLFNIPRTHPSDETAVPSGIIPTVILPDSVSVISWNSTASSAPQKYEPAPTILATQVTRLQASSVVSSNESIDDAGLKVRFANGTASHSSRISFASPNPENENVQNELSQEYIQAEKSHRKSIRQLRGLASKSKGKAKARGSKVKVKIADTILRKYKAGETVRVDRMLVLIERALNVAHLTRYTEAYNIDTRVTDRWREYYVVLKKTDNPELPLEMQLHELDDGQNFEKKPDHSLLLSSRISADFYCASDKSISVLEPMSDGVRIFILNAKFSSVAFKWLYVIKEFVQDTLDPTLNVNIPGLDLQLRVRIPMRLLRNALTPATSVTLIQTEKGYLVEYEEALQYLKDEIFARLKRVGGHHEGVHHWLETNTSPWFCFRYYDRLEWIHSNTRFFYVQNQLQSGKYTLEFREMAKPPLYTKTLQGVELKQPYPIEGFLARVTNTSGKAVSNFRAFYKILYFYSSDSILFFTKFFKGVPPSPENDFLDMDNDKAEICTLIPSIYTKDPFALDENERITWLDSPNFNELDKQAMQEFERRVQQVTKADAIIDLCSVRNVRAIDVKKIYAPHLYFQSLFWYSSPTTIEDEEIIDCAFEIELINGSKLRLLAPSRNIRNEWVQRLNELVAYWRNRQTTILESSIHTRKYNLKRLQINENVDSNIVNEAETLEMSLSRANAYIYHIGGLAMSGCLVKYGYLYQKHKKHSNFSQYYVMLCPGYMLMFSLYKRSKTSGTWKKTPYFEHYLTIPLSECYIYSGNATALDLVHKSHGATPGHDKLSRLYADGWKSSEEETQRCFTIWFGKKRKLRHEMGLANNPGLAHMVRKLGITGKSMVFLARSRQEREAWVLQTLTEINRYCKS